MMRDTAKEAITDFMPEESHLWARIAEIGDVLEYINLHKDNWRP